MKYRNKGQISIFACLMLCAFLILILAVLQGIRMWEGRAKCSQAVTAATNSIKGDYQPDLFRRYHLIALDKTYYGRGEGFLEERGKEYLEYNLNAANGLYHFNVDDVILTNTEALTDGDLSGLKQQIQEYMELKLPVNVLEAVFNKAEGMENQDKQEEMMAELEEIDGLTETGFSVESLESPTAETVRLLGLEELLANQGITDFNNLSVEDLLEMDLTGQNLILNPQTVMEDMMNTEILYLVMPEQVSAVSKEAVDLQHISSSNRIRDNQNRMWDMDRNIQSVSDIATLCSEDVFQEPLNHIPTETDALYGIAYAMDSFQYFGNEFDTAEGVESHVLEYEVEYILAGQESDYENLSRIAEELCMIRFVPNAVYAFTDEEMKETALLLAALLLAPVGLEGAAEPVSYVFLACWAYAESIMDVRGLFQGDYVPLIKDKESWQLSLTGIQKLATEEPSGCEQTKGMNYEEYLMILLGIMPNQNLKYYRMLDIIQGNIQANISEFKIENCIYEFQLQVKIRENFHTWYLEREGSYLS